MRVLRLSIAGALVSTALLPLAACDSAQNCGPTSEPPWCGGPTGGGPLNPTTGSGGGTVGNPVGSDGGVPGQGGGSPSMPPADAGGFDPGDASVVTDGQAPVDDAGMDGSCDADMDMCEAAEVETEGTMQAPDGSDLVFDRASVGWSEADPNVVHLRAHALDPAGEARWLEITIVGTSANAPPEPGLYGPSAVAMAPLDASLRACEPGHDELSEVEASVLLTAFDPQRGMTGVLSLPGSTGSWAITLEMPTVCKL